MSSATFNPKLDEFLSKLEKLTKTKNGWESCCPGHDDQRPSLTITEGQDGKILLHCQSNGCEPANIMQCVGMSARDLFLPRASPLSGKRDWGEMTASYDYRRADGSLSYQVCRYEKPDTVRGGPNDGAATVKKTFQQRALQPDGSWAWKMTGVTRLLYRLPELMAGDVTQPVVVCEQIILFCAAVKHAMKKLIIFIGLFISLAGCKKTVENVQQDLVVKAMTDGQWAITSFILNGTNITPDFSTYKFKYYSNKTVDAIKNGTVEKTGNWDGNASAMTTWASFSSATYPLSLINGTWNITNNGWTFVVATQNNGSETKTMRLDKQ